MPQDMDENAWQLMRLSLQDFRIVRQISLRALATELGIHYSAMSRFEKGDITPKVTLVIGWCRVLDIDFATCYKAAADDAAKKP